MQNTLKDGLVTMWVYLMIYLIFLPFIAEKQAHAADRPPKFTSVNDGAIQPMLSEHSVPMASMPKRNPNESALSIGDEITSP